ncbi:MAG: RHS repeat-associated core domain-containing protein [Polyangiaceae bacterium]
MARTAPVPNIPAPPGMNPGAFVAGGGGDGGGAGGKGSRNGNGEEGAGTGDGDDDANGDGNCGGAAGDACNVHEDNPAAGDPVELSTGRVFTVAVTDLFLPGPFPFVFKRQYSSTIAGVDRGLGYGWSHSFAWRVYQMKKTLVVHTGEDRMAAFAFPTESGIAELSEGGWRVWAESTGIVVDARDGLQRHFVRLGESDDWIPTKIVDPNGNTITLTHDDDGALVGAVDAVGRSIRFPQTPTGQIGRIEVFDARANRWVTFTRYGYVNSDLVEAANADGETSRFSYTPEHRLEWQQQPSGLTFHYRYLPDGRCYESWGDFGAQPDASLSTSVPKFLADGTTKALGVHHVRIEYADDGYVEVVDSVQILRYQMGGAGATLSVSDGAVTTREFDEHRNLISRTEPDGAVTRYEYDLHGQVVATTTPDGHRWETHRDRRGLVERETQPDGGVWLYEYDTVGNISAITDPIGARTSYQRDQRGQIVRCQTPLGGYEETEFDPHGNVVRFRKENNVERRFEYDFFGRMLVVHGTRGEVVKAAYTPFGKQSQVVDADGSVHGFRYDSAGRIAACDLPDKTSVRFEYGGQDRLVAIVHATGEKQRFAYDREGRCIEAWNETGEEFRAKLTLGGHPEQETYFDGRSVSYARDAHGRLVSQVLASGEVVNLEYDIMGRLVRREYSDGAVHELEYDACGRPIAMRSPRVECRLLRDAAGRAISETQTVDGDTITLDYRYDALGNVLELGSSLGTWFKVQRDASGVRKHTEANSGLDVTHQLDASGGEVVRRFASGARLELSFDVVHQLRGLGLFGATDTARSIGPITSPRPNFARSFEYSSDGGLALQGDPLANSARQFDYDSRGQLTKVTRDGTTLEQFGYDARGNVMPSGQHRRYGAGNRIEEWVDWSLNADPDARLIEKSRRLDDVRRETWSFEWNTDGTLARAIAPDGASTTYVYDPLGRRVLKTHDRIDTRGHRIQFTTRYVWDGDLLIHEIRRSSTEVKAEERTYVYTDIGYTPWAMHVTTRDADGSAEEGIWRYLTHDPFGSPLVVSDDRGSVLLEYERTAFGEFSFRGDPDADFGVRFQGQWFDAETGLHYNRHRYYDPRLGRYISPDPAGLPADINEFVYGANPITDIDPFGLVHTATARRGRTPVRNSMTGGTDFNSGWSGRAGNRDTYLQRRAARGASFGELYRESHSEFKIMRQLDPTGRGNPSLRGQTLRIHGQKRSCPNCAAELERFARRNGMRVEYTSDEDRHNDRPLVIDHRPGRRPTSNRAAYSSITTARTRRAAARRRARG